ncbi:hypothetical protein ACFLUJ_03065 [Chloroflexota bacterium]
MDNNSTMSNTNLILEEELRAALVDGRLPCQMAFKMSRRHKVSLKKIGDIANRLNVKISNCQLGCFP